MKKAAVMVKSPPVIVAVGRGVVGRAVETVVC